MPLILMSDGTQLTTYSGDKKAWPIYLTIGNISQAFRGKLSNHTTVLLAFLPIPPKIGNVSAIIKRQIQENTYRIIQTILGHILLPIRVEENKPPDSILRRRQTPFLSHPYCGLVCRLSRTHYSSMSSVWSMSVV